MKNEVKKIPHAAILRVGSNFVLFLMRLAAECSIRERFAHFNCPRDPVRVCDHDHTAGGNHNVSIDTHGLMRVSCQPQVPGISILTRCRNCRQQQSLQG